MENLTMIYLIFQNPDLSSPVYVAVLDSAWRRRFLTLTVMQPIIGEVSLMAQL